MTEKTIVVLNEIQSTKEVLRLIERMATRQRDFEKRIEDLEKIARRTKLDAVKARRAAMKHKA